MHLGNARSALLGWLFAKSQGGRFSLRIEDLDEERCRPEKVDLIFADLEYLGLPWDGEVLFQSRRKEHYRAALATLTERGRAFLCSCSRADIARAASAPHAGEEGPLYPGTCRQGARADRPHSVRFACLPGQVSFFDGLCGRYDQDVEKVVGDFVLQRADGVASYQLAVVVDDAAQGITQVVRGADLLSSTPRQLQLYEALDLRPPTFAHVPLLLDEDGKRLAKRDDDSTVEGLRKAGFTGPEVVALLARSCGLDAPEPLSPDALLKGFSPLGLRQAHPITLPAHLRAPPVS